jgi:polar amino acid transport system substrate-binding protein
MIRRAVVVSVLALTTVLSGAGRASPDAPARTWALRLASTPWSPFTNVKPPRFANDLVHEALERNGILERTTIIEEGRLSPALEQGKYDGSAALWRSPERERYLLYSDPYLENRLILVGRKGADVSAEKLSDVAGRKVAIVAGSAYGEAVEGAKGPEFVVGPNHELNLRKLLEGKIDYMLVDAIVIRYILDHYAQQARARLEIGKTPLVKRTLHFALRRDLPDAPRIVSLFNAEIHRMLADGTYNRVLDLNWIRADVDGDGVADLILRGDQAGKRPPEGSGYEVLTIEAPVATGATKPSTKGPHFVIGGETYPDWAMVPKQYKVWDQAELDRERSRATLFQFEF